jgi:hypothetical protein
MTIGFMGTEIALLALFKETVQKFPVHDYVAYIDTEKREVGHVELEMGIQWLLQKNTDVIVVGENISCEELQTFTELPQLILAEQLHAYLQNAEHEEGGGEKVRAIYITQHTKAQDQAIAELLGGFFIEE